MVDVPPSTVAIVPTGPTPPNVSDVPAAPSGMPQPGAPMFRQRTKGPQLTRPMLTTPLEPPPEPSKPADPVEPTIVNPLDQLKMVVLWFEISLVICYHDKLVKGLGS